MGIPLSDSLWAAQTYWAFNALNFTAAKANPKCKSPYEMWYGRTPPSPFPFLKPGFVKRKRTNKLEPPAVPCFYVGPSPNRPRDSMRVIFSSGPMIDSRDVTWARIPRLASVSCEQGGQEPTELQEMESVEGETNLSDGESDELQSDRQKSTGDEEDDDDEESIFPLVVDPAPTREAARVGRAATKKANFQPIEVECPERAHNSSIGVGGSDVDASPVSTSPRSNADGAMPSPVLGGREARRLEWTAAGPTGTVEGRTRGDFRRLQAVQNASLIAGEVGLVSAREDSAFRAKHTVGRISGKCYVWRKGNWYRDRRDGISFRNKVHEGFFQFNRRTRYTVVRRAHISVAWRRFCRVKSRLYVMTMFLQQVSRTQRLDM